MSWLIASSSVQGNKIQVIDKDFLVSEIGLGIDELKNPNWINEIVSYYDASHKGLKDAIYLTLLASISSSLIPIPYSGSPIRSKLNLLLRGQHGGGKGFLMEMIEKLSPNVQKMGATTSAALLGGVDKQGKWVPGKAYWAKYGILIIRELFQSFRAGEWYADISSDLNEICEFPHEVSKTNLGSIIKDVAQAKLEYPDVAFPHNNEFQYHAPVAVIAGVPELSLYDILTRVSEGFMSRFIEIPISYDRIEAESGIHNFWGNVLPAFREDAEILQQSQDAKEQQFRRCFYMLYSSNLGRWYDVSLNPASLPRRIEPVRGFILPDKLRKLFEEESIRCLNRSLDNVQREFKLTDVESVRPPILFRECGDLLRLACCDAVSRRFAGTEHEGYIRVDDAAANKAVQFLYMITETSVNHMVESRKIKKLATIQTASLFWLEYDLIRQSGHMGIPSADFFVGLEKNFRVSRKRAETRLKKLCNSELVEERDGVLYATILTRIKPTFRGWS